MSSMFTTQRSVAQPTRKTFASLGQHESTQLHETNFQEKISSWFTSGLPTPPGAKAMTGYSMGSGVTSYPLSHDQYRPYGVSERPNGTAAHHQHRMSNSSQTSNGYSQPSKPLSTTGYGAVNSEKNAGNLIASYLQIPESVNKSKGSLAEFAAEITCLFWFETAPTLQHAEDLNPQGLVERGLLADAVPSIGFRKWVTTILSTTQVGKNVILLALMFIYRLKKFNPTVSGKRGSEFRLLTIALMLGNKFLDDNTYTNKTWAEVSGISVTEIHIMEVEFLSNMRYDLYASESEWNEWKGKLGRFGAFYEKAVALPRVEESNSSTAPPITPTSQSFPAKLPSPPSTHHSSASYSRTGSHHNSYSSLPNPAMTVPILSRSPARQQRLPSVDHLDQRKRSLDMSSDLPPAKRIHFPSQTHDLTSTYTPGSYSSASTGASSVPPMHVLDAADLERSKLVTNHLSMNHAGTQLAPLSLPANRSMSTVYPGTSVAWSQPVTPISAVPANLYHNTIPNLGDSQRSHTSLGSATTSPRGYNTVAPTLPGLSPSYFLTNRSSPYRPVRNVNTLLIPPPSTALQNPIRNLAHDQIHYHPLSKTATERRTGPVPFLYPDGWYQSNATTPLTQAYPYRP